MNWPYCGGGVWDMRASVFVSSEEESGQARAVAGSPRATTRGAAVMLQASAPLDGALWTPRSRPRRVGGGGPPPKIPGRSGVEWNRLNLVDVALVRRRGAPDRDPEDPGEESRGVPVHHPLAGGGHRRRGEGRRARQPADQLDAPALGAGRAGGRHRPRRPRGGRGRPRRRGPPQRPGPWPPPASPPARRLAARRTPPTAPPRPPST